jgi:hypothetical protein
MLLRVALFAAPLFQIVCSEMPAVQKLTRAGAEVKYKALLLQRGSVDHSAASSLLGILYCQMQRPDEAASLLERAPAIDWVAHEFMG